MRYLTGGDLSQFDLEEAVAWEQLRGFGLAADEMYSSVGEEGRGYDPGVLTVKPPVKWQPPVILKKPATTPAVPPTTAYQFPGLTAPWQPLTRPLVKKAPTPVRAPAAKPTYEALMAAAAQRGQAIREKALAAKAAQSGAPVIAEVVTPPVAAEVVSVPARTPLMTPDVFAKYEADMQRRIAEARAQALRAEVESTAAAKRIVTSAPPVNAPPVISIAKPVQTYALPAATPEPSLAPLRQELVSQVAAMQREVAVAARTGESVPTTERNIRILENKIRRIDEQGKLAGVKPIQQIKTTFLSAVQDGLVSAVSALYDNTAEKARLAGMAATSLSKGERGFLKMLAEQSSIAKLAAKETRSRLLNGVDPAQDSPFTQAAKVRSNVIKGMGFGGSAPASATFMDYAKGRVGSELMSSYGPQMTAQGLSVLSAANNVGAPGVAPRKALEDMYARINQLVDVAGRNSETAMMTLAVTDGVFRDKAMDFAIDTMRTLAAALETRSGGTPVSTAEYQAAAANLSQTNWGITAIASEISEPLTRALAKIDWKASREKQKQQLIDVAYSIYQGFSSVQNIPVEMRPLLPEIAAKMKASGQVVLTQYLAAAYDAVNANRPQDAAANIKRFSDHVTAMMPLVMNKMLQDSPNKEVVEKYANAAFLKRTGGSAVDAVSGWLQRIKK